MQLERRWIGVVVMSLFAALAIAACGPSSGQIKAARNAHYQTDAQTVFKAAVDAASENAKVAQADAATGVIATEARWYEKDGTYVNKALGSDTGVRAADGAILLGFEVRVTGGDGVYAVEIIPHAQQIRTGYAAPFPIEPNDPAMPGWVSGKLDDLYLAVYAKLKAYEVKPRG